MRAQEEVMFGPDGALAGVWWFDSDRSDYGFSHIVSSRRRSREMFQ